MFVCGTIWLHAVGLVYYLWEWLYRYIFSLLRQQVDVEEERYLMQQESNRRADTRYKQALEKQRREQMFQEYEQKYQIIARYADSDN